MNVRAGGGGNPLVCVPSAEDMFGEWFDNRSASRVMNHRQRIGKSFRMIDRSVSRVMNYRHRSKVRMIAFFENVKFHREKRQIRRPFSETDFGDRFRRRFLAIFSPTDRQILMV